MMQIKDRNQFPKMGSKVLLWIGLLYASLGQALGQVQETADKSSETADKSSETADKSSETADKSSETADKSSETAEPVEFSEEEKDETKPMPGSLQDFSLLWNNNIFDQAGSLIVKRENVQIPSRNHKLMHSPLSVSWLTLTDKLLSCPVPPQNTTGYSSSMIRSIT